MRLSPEQIMAVMSLGHKVYTYRGGTRIYYLDPKSLNPGQSTASRIDYTTNEVIAENVSFRDTGSYWYDTDIEALITEKFSAIKEQYEVSQKNVASFERLKSIIPERFI